MREDEGRGCQAVLANQEADYEGVINVTQGIKMSGGTELTAAQVTAWVAGATAGASITTSNTGTKYVDAVDVIPRMSKSQMETAVKAGQFIFKVDTSQNVTAVYDINSLVSTTVEKGKLFTKNRLSGRWTISATTSPRYMNLPISEKITTTQTGGTC